MRDDEDAKMGVRSGYLAMTFNDNVKLDPSQVEDVRGGRSIGGRTALAGGGGLLGIVVFVVVTLLGGSGSQAGDLGSLLDQALGQGAAGAPAASSTLATECRTGADANARDDCRIVGYIDSIQAYWTGAFTQERKQYAPSITRFFSGTLQTGCGPASADVGPFYCPSDGYVYIDLGFFDELRAKFGATGGPFAQAYVLAHEYGHHVQDLLGLLGSSSGQAGATSQSVRTELQADCLAGVWAHNAQATGYLQPLTKAQIADALDAAAAVGDDRIQAEFQGRVTPESWTHGSSAQRQKWFTAGWQDGSLNTCDTSGGL
jgi:predicted metalloprotease